MGKRYLCIKLAALGKLKVNFLCALACTIKQKTGGDIMVYKTAKYSNREEAMEALRKMIQRKHEWVEKTEQEFEELAKLKTTDA